MFSRIGFLTIFYPSEISNVSISLKKIMPLQKQVYELDLASKGLGGITKEQFWQELDNIVIALTTP